MRRNHPITPENDPIARGQRIRQARQFAGLTARELAKRIDYSNANLSSNESGKRPLQNEELMKKICEATGVTLEWLKSGIGDPIADSEQRHAFYKKSGALVKTVVMPINDKVFLSIHQELRILADNTDLTEVDLITLTIKGYSTLMESATNEEDLVKLVPGVARLVFNLR